MSEPICTCEWSITNTTSEDPPYPVRLDPNCQVHASKHIAERLDKDVEDFNRGIEKMMARMEDWFGKDFFR